jgi:hypothetical protein
VAKKSRLILFYMIRKQDANFSSKLSFSFMTEKLNI